MPAEAFVDARAAGLAAVIAQPHGSAGAGRALHLRQVCPVPECGECGWDAIWRSAWPLAAAWARQHGAS